MLAGQVAHLPVLAVALPRALELVGVAYLLDAANRYGADGSASPRDDLAAAAKKGGDAVRNSPGSELFTFVFRREANVTNARDVRDVRDVRDTR